ncbi:cysteine-rich small domain-containing protein [Collinsella stercoris]|uniref:cysteine-rich small domain-containing protein n=1 Tax=Collinsella stercoris TaxID=147206 RepID=UPI003AEFBAC7
MVGENGDMSDAPSGENYRFFNHSACEFYPCHDMPAEDLNCLFCFCPLYRLGEDCGGTFTYVNGADGARIKDCSTCTVPHRRENYDCIIGRLASR